jgi:hypothetical protein
LWNSSHLQEEILIRLPKGVANGTFRVLLKSIYGLKQASREWYPLLSTTLTSLGLKPSTSINHPVHGICIALVYVDDILVVSDSLDWITTAKAHIP